MTSTVWIEYEGIPSPKFERRYLVTWCVGGKIPEGEIDMRHRKKKAQLKNLYYSLCHITEQQLASFSALNTDWHRRESIHIYSRKS